MIAYDAVVLRLVPRVHVPSGEALGVALHARQAHFLGIRWIVPPRDVADRWQVSPVLLTRYLDGLATICDGSPDGGPIGRLPPSERFHWLAATRSTILQPSEVHTGLCDAPVDALNRIVESLMPTTETR
ncbi:MAG: DUF3037 domain-containing protein [Rubricoccaceae bacterium]